MTSSTPSSASAITALPPSVRLSEGAGGLPRLTVAAPGGSAEIYLQGAHLTSWHPDGQDPVIWLSRSSVFAAGKPIRGGIPICFPWFGPNDADATAPLHGLARLCDWTLVAADEVGDGVAVTFQLIESAATGSGPWPFPFEATYCVVVGSTLRLSLEITNTGNDAVTFDEALHTYFAVGDVRRVAVLGLAGASYADRNAGSGPIRQDDEPIRIEQETDRMYPDSAGTVTIEDTAGDRVIRVAKDGSASTVVWNPWVDKARAMPDFGDDEWLEMICVESCNAGSTAVVLAAGDGHRMTTSLDVVPL